MEPYQSGYDPSLPLSFAVGFEPADGHSVATERRGGDKTKGAGASEGCCKQYLRRTFGFDVKSQGLVTFGK